MNPITITPAIAGPNSRYIKPPWFSENLLRHRTALDPQRRTLCLLINRAPRTSGNITERKIRCLTTGTSLIEDESMPVVSYVVLIHLSGEQLPGHLRRPADRP